MKLRPKQTDKDATEKRPRVGDILDLVISNLNENGYGISHSGELPVLVSGALPGESVRVKVTFSGRREAFATVIKVLRHSPARLQTPPCARSTFCDSCRFVSMKYPAQLDWKKGMVENAIRGYASLKGATLHPILPSPMQLHYRGSARFIVSGKFTDPLIGIKNHNNRDVVELGDCPLYHPLINRIVQVVKEGIRKGKVPVYSPRSDSGILRNLSVRVSEAENRAMVTFVTAERSFNEIHHLSKYLQAAVPEVEVMAQIVNNPSGKFIIGEKDYFVTRKRSLSDMIGDTRIIITPRSFFPVNHGGTLLSYEKAREWAGNSGQEIVLDLFFGNGCMSLFLSRCAKVVMGIEATAASVEEAEKNARLNGIRNCRFEAGDVSELLIELRKKRVSPGLIVINMPAKGCEREVLQRVAALSPARIIHISGALQQLALDLDILSRFGYRILEVQPMDMFPQTPRVDTLTLMVKEKGTSPDLIYS